MPCSNGFNLCRVRYDVAEMMFNHLRRQGQPFVTPEAVADFVDADKMEEAFDLIGGSDAGVRALALANISVAVGGVVVVCEAESENSFDP